MRLNVPLAHGLAALVLCAMPLLVQANCTSPNTDADYILGDLEGDGAAMHWESGLVWKRCLEGQSFDGSQCTGSGTTKAWNTWAETDALLPQTFTGQDGWGISAGLNQNLLQSGAWRLAYKDELVKITENCGDAPTLNRVVFPNDPASFVWSGSLNPGGLCLAWGVNFGSGKTDDGVCGPSSPDLSPARLVRGGQAFASLSTPATQTAAVGTQASFAAITLAASTGSGQAWGGMRISGDGDPEFQVNGGAWVQEAIVKSSDQITVRLTAPAAVGGSHSATLTLRSGQTTGTSADASNGGTEATAMQETSASFTVTAGYTATVSAEPAAGGAVLCTPHAAAPGATMTCTATPATGWQFSAWTGDCAGQGAICTLSNVQAAKAAVAQFTALPNCPTGPNTDANYILGNIDSTASAMHWESGLVWKRCREGQSFTQSGGYDECTGEASNKNWNDWSETQGLLPQSFTNQNTFGISPDFSQNLLHSGVWRMAYSTELLKITESCGDRPKTNRVVFTNTPLGAVISGTLTDSNPTFVNFINGTLANTSRLMIVSIRLVRGGQSFAVLTDPAAQTVVAGTQTSFAPITLAASTGSGQAWGGVRISGDGDPEFQVNGGAWVQEAIVQSGDQLTVRLTAPAAAGSSHSATLALRSGQTSGSADVAVAALGTEATAMQETSASFTVASLVPVDGACGSARATPSATAPASNLCSAGTPAAVSGSSGQWQWDCMGSNGGTNTVNNACTAPYASQTLTISANPVSIPVGGGSAISITANGASGQPVTLTNTGACTLNGSTVTGTAVGSCAITASQTGTGDTGTSRYLPAADVATIISVTAIPTYPVTASASPAAGGTVTCTPSSVTHGGNASCTATPNTGYSFSGFSGDCTGSTCSLSNITSAQTVTASFTQDSHAITAIADPAAGGSVSCTPNPVPHGNDASCSATANTGYTFSGFGGDCSGSTCSLSNVTSAKSVMASFTPDDLTLPEGPLAGETLEVSVAPTNGWALAEREVVTVASLNAPALPPEVQLPYGVVSMRLDAGGAGSQAQVVLTYPQAFPAGTQYYKYGKTSTNPQPHWYAFEHAVISGNTITLTLTDGGAGDDDLSANGVIVDPGGPAVPAAGPMGTPVAVPTLSEWAMLLMAGLLGVLGAGVLRRRAVA